MQTSSQILSDLYTGNSPKEIFENAKQLAYNAAVAFDATLPPEVSRGFDCGFAWVTVRPARGKFVQWCRANNLGSKAYNGGWQFWYSDFSTSTQSISVHQCAAKVFCDVLKASGLDASVGSRLD